MHNFTPPLSEHNKELAILSLTDPLTNMANRRHAMQQLSLLWAGSEKHNLPLCCWMIDIPDGHLSLSTSIGIATKTAQMTSIEDLIKAADDGVYDAKSNGRGCTKSIQ
jgi:PleD family two-component response regulator